MPSRFAALVFVALMLPALVAYAATIEILPGDTAHCATSWASTPTPTSANCSADSIAGVPVCIDHNPLIYHDTVKRNPDNSIACTYGHEHGDDPHAVDGIFGLPGAWWNDGAEQDIAYPWVTSPKENALSPPYGDGKHNLFKWITRSNLLPAHINSNGWYWRDFRVLDHLLGSGGNIPGASAKDGFQMQIHSFQAEARICREADPSDCGIVRIGGSQDNGYGALADVSNAEVCVFPNPFVPADVAGGPCAGGNGRHIHGDLTGNRRDFTWYGTNVPSYRSSAGFGRIGLNVGTIGEAWAAVDPTNYDALPFYPPHCCWSFQNGSWLSAEIFGLALSSVMPGYDPSTQRITGHGYVDAWGAIQPVGTCMDVGPGCIPYEVANLPVGSTLYRDSFYKGLTGINPIQEHDVIVDYAPATDSGGKASLVRYPN